MVKFLQKEIIDAGIKSAVHFKDQKVKKVTDYFQNQSNAINGLNPYLLRFVVNYLINENLPELKDLKNCISTLLNLLLV